ncbi:hypothetical protein CAEBREN_15693 [Caenorhabditis brenneri]|uniref:Uncharacterized protein n=1 Tax=Caenorhabditis brenneri TaxID=135651 RepID=G0MU70_CAEBE|nr:hypothetical protein CAEBREN_15693 [Caenorhabditis brenneri]
MNSFHIILSCLILLSFIGDSCSLTLQGLFHKLKEAKTRVALNPNSYTTEAEIDSLTEILLNDKSYIRPIASVGGRPIIPRRWTYGNQIKEVSIDENGIATPIRPPTSLTSVRRRLKFSV